MLANPTRIISLFSGSKGNCTLIRCGDTRILVDAGMSCRAIERALSSVGESLCDISAILITHEHSDHTKALPVLLKKHPVPVHLTEPTAKALVRSGFPCDCFAVHRTPFSVRIAHDASAPVIAVNAFPVPHDSHFCIGYHFTFESDSADSVNGAPCSPRTAAIATDMGCVTDEIRQVLTGVQDLILESNHDENMLLMGSYPYDLKRRILSDCGHLSNAAAAAFLCDLVAAGTKRILLAHLSPENNTPELAYLTAMKTLEQHGYVPDQDFSLSIARRDAPVILHDSSRNETT